MVKLSQTIFDKYNSFADDFISDNFGINCQLMYPPKETSCPNCVYDAGARRSTNIYKAGGPQPFNFGICPLCNGRGMFQDMQTEIIKLRVYWSKKYWYDIGIPVNLTDGLIQAIGFMTDLPKIKQAQMMIINSDLHDINDWHYKLRGEPIPHGFKQNRYMISYWDRV